ncbi:hypothetical protein B6N60_03003 [Richelia sinica FACHB-800]|uniref:Uncharacterized protein n=1 Tax=Richelia sinica FACHB-800 TaxID=1357546 RepID=A0A975Y5K1_9NOST|nr:hypothetical protein [Richelia sinica]QXE24299.1 hypothetical protein B6N60_03003 [Richelia sinica FACHB-800]
MPWVEKRLSNGREGKNEPKLRGLSRREKKLAAITMNKQRLYKGAAFSIVDKD